MHPCRPSYSPPVLCEPHHAPRMTGRPSVAPAQASESRRGAALGMLDLVSSTCRIVMPTAAGLCIDRFGPLAPLAVQAALSAAGIAALLAWQHQQHARDSHLTPLAKRKDE